MAVDRSMSAHLKAIREHVFIVPSLLLALELPKVSLSRHLLNRKSSLSSCSLFAVVKMGKKSFFIGPL
jgi:hypothetical protein